VSRRLPADAAEREAVLRKEFGLPAGVAREYLEMLFPPERVSPLVARLRKALAASREANPGDPRDEPHP
jgi:hypothetical protein